LRFASTDFARFQRTSKQFNFRSAKLLAFGNPEDPSRDGAYSLIFGDGSPVGNYEVCRPKVAKKTTPQLLWVAVLVDAMGYLD
jgi:hypothetical protein